MTVDRRQMMVAGLGLGLALAVRTRAWAAAHATQIPSPFSTYGVVPAGGAIDQTATLQLAADQSAQTGTPFFLPPGIYATRRLELKSGTQLKGVPGKSILRYAGGGALLGIDQAQEVRLEGLVLDGGGKPLGNDGALLVATEATRLEVSNCRFAGSSENGVMLRQVSGRIAACEIGGIRKEGLCSEDAGGLEIARNHIHDCGANGIFVRRFEGVIADNIVERTASGIAVTNMKEGGRLAVVQGNLVRNLFFRKSAETRGNGIAVEACTVVSGNVVENAPGFGILVGGMRYRRDVSITGNLVRKAHIGIGVAAEEWTGSALITGNSISGAADGAIRAMRGPAPIGPDLAREGAEAFRTLAVYANVAG